MPKNLSGMKVKCPNPNCGYTWYYKGSNPVTSCPRCGYRTRVTPSRQISTQGGDALLPERKSDRLI